MAPVEKVTNFLRRVVPAVLEEESEHLGALQVQGHTITPFHQFTNSPFHHCTNSTIPPYARLPSRIAPP